MLLSTVRSCRARRKHSYAVQANQAWLLSAPPFSQFNQLLMAELDALTCWGQVSCRQQERFLPILMESPVESRFSNELPSCGCFDGCRPGYVGKAMVSRTAEGRPACSFTPRFRNSTHMLVPPSSELTWRLLLGSRGTIVHSPLAVLRCFAQDYSVDSSSSSPETQVCEPFTMHHQG
jgi:hypothetical protein